MDHVGPWLFVAVLLVGSVARLARGARRPAERASTGGVPPAAPAGRLAELQRGRAVVPPPPPPAAGPRRPGSANPRTTAPTRRVPLGGARADFPSPGDELGASASPGGRALAGTLRTPAGLRNAVVLAEVLAPPVALR